MGYPMHNKAGKWLHVQTSHHVLQGKTSQVNSSMGNFAGRGRGVHACMCVCVCVCGGWRDRSHRSHKFKHEKCCRKGEVSVGERGECVGVCV